MMNVQAISNAAPETKVSQASAKQSTVFQDTVTNKLKVPADLNAIFEEASKAYGVPSSLLKAVGKAESDFRTGAVSRCGAQGVMQLMPATAKGLGVTDSFDPRQNIMGGAKYLSQMLDKYDGNAKLALAAYNAGSNNVDKYNGIPPFKETQNYVVKVMKYAGEDMAVVPARAGKTAANPAAAAVQPPKTSAPAVFGTPSQRVSSADTDSYYRNILNEITNFENFTTDDYLLFLELLKSSLQTPAFGDNLNITDSSNASLLLGNRYQTLF